MKGILRRDAVKNIVIVGAGKIGSMIAELLVGSGDYAVTVVDRSQQQLDRLETAVSISKIVADITHGDALRQILAGKFAVLSAAPYHATRTIAEAAKAAGAHYLTEPHRRCGQHPRRETAGSRRGHSFHPSMRLGARLHHHSRKRSCVAVR